MKQFKSLALGAVCTISLLASCTTYQRAMTDSNSLVNFTSKDFAITPAYGGMAKRTRVIGIDWAHLFKRKEGEISVPIVGSVTRPSSVDAFALYDLMKAHPNYDAIFYPQFKRKHFSFLGIYSYTRVEVKARLGRLETGNGEGDNTKENGE